MLLRFSIFILLLLPTLEVRAQKIVRSVIGSTGSSSQSGGIQLHETSGQAAPVTKTIANNTTLLSQGFHRSNRLLYSDNGIQIVVYPNPNSGQFQFYTDLPAETSFQFQVIDITGRIIQMNSGKGKEVISVDISTCSSGTYILRIITPQSTANIKLEKTP
jgi:hypothetical protein